MNSWIKKQYSDTFKKEFVKNNKLINVMQVPKVVAIILSLTTKDAITNKNLLKELTKQLMLICGQKPIITQAKKSISGFKLREKMDIGLKVTLRGKNMNHFYDKFVNIICPRIRDFDGFSLKSFDNFGNYNLGIKEQIVFPEIDYSKIKKIYGLNITINTNTVSKSLAIDLLKNLGFPFKIKDSNN